MTGIINAGGRSTRMGTNKALMRLGGHRLIDLAVAVLRPLFAEVLIIANDPAAFSDTNVRVVPDLVAGVGPLGGIYTALSVAADPSAFVVACDMPFLSRPFIAYLRDFPEPYDVLVPRTADNVHTLHAVYTKTCLPKIRALLDAGAFRVDGLFPEVVVRYVDEAVIRRFDPELLGLLNVNRPEEFARAEALWAARAARPRREIEPPPA